MKREIKAPSVGESITEVRIGGWKKQNGEAVKAGEVIVEIESDKATVEVIADSAGALQILRQPGETVKIGEVLGVVDEGAAGVSVPVAAAVAPHTTTAPKSPDAPALAKTVDGSPASAPHAPVGFMSPSARRAAAEAGVLGAPIPGSGSGGTVLKSDVMHFTGGGASTTAPAAAPQAVMPTRAGERRVPMTLLRQKIAERLVQAQHTAAILTTFNECDMTEVNSLRAKHKEAFKTKYGVSLGFMSFFTRAVVEALKEVPAVNAMIDGKDVIYRDYHDIGVAVGTERGLVVPVLRDVTRMGFADIEKGITALAGRAKENKLSIKELTGGTFTISNGGTYGSLLSTPILNPPQSGILGMHKIQDRPMVVGGQIVVRPMMYLALSYDHRLIDGKEAVTFLVKVKEGIENPVAKLGFNI